MKRLERKWARLAIIMVVVAVCSLILIMITKWMIWNIPLWGGAIAFVVIRKKKLECPYCHMVYIPHRWDSSVHYRCRNCRRIIYYDDDGDVEEAEI